MIEIKDVARLDVKPGETLCFWVEEIPRDPETGELLDIAEALKGSLPDGVKVIAFEGNVGVGILSAADVERVMHPPRVVTGVELSALTETPPHYDIGKPA